MMTIRYEGESGRELVIETISPDRTKISVADKGGVLFDLPVILDDRSLRMLGNTLLGMTNEYIARKAK